MYVTNVIDLPTEEDKNKPQTHISAIPFQSHLLVSDLDYTHENGQDKDIYYATASNS